MRYNKKTGNVENWAGVSQIVTADGAFEFFGWMQSAAKRSPKLAKEIEAFAKASPSSFRVKQFTA